MLTLYDELYLLALDEEKGNIFRIVRKSLPYALAGAILTELALLGKVEAGEKSRLTLLEATPTGDPILDETMEQISASEKVRKLTYWVSRLSEDPKKLRQNVVERLVGKNVLLEEEKHFFRQPPMTGSEISALNKFQLKYLLRSITLSNGESDPRSLALLNLAVAGDLLGLIFTQDEIEIAYRMIHKQVMEAAMENQVMQFIEEIELAVSSVLENETE